MSAAAEERGKIAHDKDVKAVIAIRKILRDLEPDEKARALGMLRDDIATEGQS